MLTGAYWLINNLIVLPLYKRNYIQKLIAKPDTIHHPRQNYLVRASEAYIKVQEVLPQLLTEIIIVEGESPIVAAYVNHLMHKILVTLSFLNEHSFTAGKNINDFAHQARTFALKPLSYDEFANFHAQYLIADYPRLKCVAQAIVVELGELIEGEMKKETEFSTGPNSVSSAGNLPLSNPLCKD